MNVARGTFTFFIGGGIGIYMAFYLVIAGDDSKGIGRVIVLIESPIMLMAQWVFGTLSIGVYMILHLGFWFVLGGLLFLGGSVLLSKAKGQG